VVFRATKKEAPQQKEDISKEVVLDQELQVNQWEEKKSFKE
jgi:hypothetical protein